MRSPPTLAGYATIVFDCDGVLLDSNGIKTNAFREVAHAYGEAPAGALVAHHRMYGGVSRNAKFQHFVCHILGRTARDGEVERLVDRYAAVVAGKLKSCAAAQGLQALRHATAGARWMVVSGGAEAELRSVFDEHGLSTLFDEGIFGSPQSKDEIFAREIEQGRLRLPAVYLGDSRYDHEAARRAGMDFIFVSGWTEFVDWQDYCREHELRVVSNIGLLAGWTMRGSGEDSSAAEGR